MIGVVMVTDVSYANYAYTALQSVRQFNRAIPIRLYTCGELPQLAHCAKLLNFEIEIIPQPTFPEMSPRDQSLAWTRIAKFVALKTCPFSRGLYLDADVIAFADVAQIAEVAANGLHSDDVYMLLRRPHIPNLYSWRRPYIHDADDFTVEEVNELINETFGLTITVSEMNNLCCWNGGVIYGSGSVLKRLGETWLNLYHQMLTGLKRQNFTPKDQFCLWIAAHKLRHEMSFHELPLAWNFMIAHIDKSGWSAFTLDQLFEIVRNQAKLLHLGDAKRAVWAEHLRLYVNTVWDGEHYGQ